MSTKKSLLVLCSVLGIKNVNSKTKIELKEIIKSYEDSVGVKVISTGKKIKYIYHIADIHIRHLDRHVEYQQVFDRLKEELKNREYIKESVVVICGDIFHNKDKLVSESILLFDNLVKGLTEITDVVMILGNHDTFTHGDRLDTVSGITSITSYPGLYFLKDSGVYKYNNIDFVVSSLLDNKFIRHADIPPSENTTVALYHGPVYGCKLDNGTSLNESGLFKTSDFKGFDYTLLGDIHKRQYLTPSIAYPGSLIQQNHKESLDQGMIVWDLENKTSSFIKVENDYGYVTVSVKNGLIENLDSISFPKRSRIKILHTYSEDLDLEAVKKQLQSKTVIISTTKEILNVQNGVEETEETIVYSREQLDTIFFKDLTKMYSKETQDSLEAIHSQALYKESNSDSTESFPWEIDYLEFMNMFIYGGDVLNKIDFQNLPGVIGILSSNASGKSTLIHIIMYCLYGNIFKSKDSSNRNIINKNSEKFYIKMVILSKDTRYIIEKAGKNKNKKGFPQTMEETVSFKSVCIDSGIEKCLSGANKLDTVDIIHSVLGLPSKDSFILTNILSYTNYSSLLNMTSSDLSQTFAELFNLEKYKEIYTATLKNHRDTVDKLKLLESEKKIILTRVVECSEKVCLDELETELALIESKLSENNKQETLLGELPETPEDTEECDTLYSLFETHKELLLTPNYNGEFSKEKVMYSLETLNKQIKKFSKSESLEPKNSENLKGDLVLKNLEKRLVETESKILSVSPVISTEVFNKLVSEETFSTTEFINDLLEYNNTNRYNENVTIPKDLYDDILQFIKEVDSPDFLNNKIKTVEYLKNKKNIAFNKCLEIEMGEIRGNIRFLLEQEHLKLKNSLKIIDINEKIAFMETIRELKENISLKKKLVFLRKELCLKKVSLIDSIKTITYKNIKSQLQKEQNEKSLIVLNEKNIQIKKLQDKEYLYKIYKGIISDKALPKMILHDTILKVEVEANHLIYKLAGLFVVLSSDDSKWVITIKKNGMILGTEQISGYEKFIVNIGLKMALDKYKFFSGVKFFCIDEALDCISSDNLHKVDDIFSELVKQYKTLVIISHNEDLKNKVDTRINIETDFICSRISVEEIL